MLKDKIKECRIGLDLSQVQLATNLGVSKQVVCDWEKGRANPKIKHLVELAKLFNTTTDYLLGLGVGEDF